MLSESHQWYMGSLDLGMVELMAVQSVNRGWVWKNSRGIKTRFKSRQESDILFWMRAVVEVERNRAGNLRGMHQRVINLTWTAIMGMTLAELGEWEEEVVCLYFF